ncbi:MAG: hypothetical protein NTY14_06360 [Candidatus Omnitrophica bacterium]|nr:hypothetical protein [Candidatus Omnitrophota bacterium]
MRKLVLLLVLALVAWGAMFTSAFAETEGLLGNAGITASGDVAFYSEYLWRGFLLDGDPVVQPGFYLSGPDSKYGKLTAKFWSSHDLSNSDPRNSSEEYDYILDYTYNLADTSLSFGHTYYDYPAADTFSKEFYVGITLPKVFLTPSVFYYRDYGSQEDGGGMGSYTVVNLAKSLPFEIKGTPASLELAGHYGYNYELFINGKGGDIGLSAGLKLQLTKNLTCMPNINYSLPLGDLEKTSDGNQEARVYTGAVFSYSF